jgi:hypothetical protein
MRCLLVERKDAFQSFFMPTTVCKGCAEMAIDTIDREVLRRAGEQPRRRVI